MNTPRPTSQEEINNTLTSSKIKDLDVKITPSDHHTGHVTVGVFDVKITNDLGSNLGTFPLEIAYPKNLDAVDTILYYEKNDQLYICTDTSLRPVLAARKKLRAGGEKIHSLAEGTYTIFDTSAGDISFEDAIRRSLKNKLGYTLEQLKIEFGSSYFPSIGGSSEVAMSCYIDITDQEKPKQGATYGHTFDAERVVQDMSLQQIVDDFFAGKTSDMRLVLHALELARKHGKALRMPNKGQVEKRWDKVVVPFGISEISGADAENQLAKLQKSQEKYTIELQPSGRAPQFIKTYNLDVTNKHIAGTQEHYQAQMAVRNGVDTLDVIPYFRSAGKLYILTKLGIRPALIARDCLQHYISLSPTISNLETISGALDAKHSIEDQATALLHKKVGTFHGTPRHAGSYFPSAGNNPEQTDLVIYPFIPTSGSLSYWQEFDCVQTPIIALELDTLFRLYEANIIKDPRLVLAANILKQQYAYANVLDRPISEVSAADRDRFQQVLNTPLQTDRFYKFSAETLNDPKIYQLHVLFKQKSPWYRRVMSYVEEELGGFFATQEALLSETDRHFFDAAVPAFAVPSAELAMKYQNYAAHDNGHYVQGTIVPTPEMSKATYIRLMSQTESLAVYDSDYRYPRELGLDEFEATIGGVKSLARSFNNLDITDPREVRQIVTQIEVDGIIPEKILRHPNYADERSNIVYRVYRFHFLDKAHAAAQYDQWMQNQEVAKVMLKFGNCVGSERQFQRRMQEYEGIIAAHGEGVNTVKAHVMRVLTRDLILPALKIGLVLQMLHDKGYAPAHPAVVMLHQYLDELDFYKLQIVKLHTTITGIEANEKNIKAVRDADSITAKIHEVVQKFESALKAELGLLLTDDQRARLGNNAIPYFTGFVDIPHDELIQMIEQGEREQIARMGNW